MSETLEALVELLLAAYHEPLRYQEQLKGPLPEPFYQVLRLATGKTPPNIESLYQQQKTNPEELRKAAIFFVEQACLGEEQNPYRVLGLNPGATPHKLQAHYHLLMLLFHPDRSEAAASWRDVYAARINEAYRRLRRPASRQAYDRELAAKGPRKESRTRVYHYRHPQDKGSFFTYLIQRFPWLIRYLPQIILGGGATVALVLIAGLYFSAEETIPVTFSVEDRVPSGVPASLQGTGEEEAFLRRLVQEPSLSLSPVGTDSPSPPLVEPTEEAVVEQARLAAGRPGMVDSSPEAPIRGVLGVGKPVVSAKPSLVSPEPKMNSEIVTRSGSAPVKTTSTATVKESVSARKKQSVALAKDKTSAPSVSTPPLHQEAMQDLLQRFTRAYQQGDLEGLLALFSPDARTNDYMGWSAIRQDYARFFASTQTRELQIRGLQWLIDGNTASGEGDYIVRIRKANRTFENRGQILIQVQNREGTNVIVGLFNTIDSQRNVSIPN